MNNNNCLLVIIIILLTCSSCQLIEEIYINEDGSGTIKFTLDSSGIMHLNEENQQREPFKKDTDTTYLFKDLLFKNKKSISKLSIDDQEKLKAISTFVFNETYNEKEKISLSGFSGHFKTLDELSGIFEGFNVIAKNRAANKLDDIMVYPSAGLGGNSKLNHSFKDGVFKRTTIVLDREKQKKTTDSFMENAMMYSHNRYKVKYHFPRPVKTVSNKNALFTADRKTVVLEYNALLFLTQPEKMNVEIILEK